MSVGDTVRLEVMRFDPEIPIERAWTPPASWYTEASFYDLERDAVFGKTWQPVARAEQVSEPGQYVSGCFAGRPWVVTRAQNNELAAFYNVCLHKGRQVVTGAGRAESLVCGYHAWSYELTGRLRKAPRIAGIEEFDREAMSLRPMRVETWGPWIFINPDPHAAPFQPRVPELAAAFERGGWRSLRYVASTEWTLECNWKVYVDNYLDGGYHVPHMHPSLDAQLSMDTYRTEIFSEYSVQTCEPAGHGQSTRAAAERIGPGAVYAWIYPNLMLNRYGPCLDSNLVVPIGPSRCKVVYDFFFDPAHEGAKEFVDASMAQSAVTQREDIEICESVQIGLASGAYDQGRYAPRVEMGEHHFHRLLAVQLRASAAPK